MLAARGETLRVWGALMPVTSVAADSATAPGITVQPYVADPVTVRRASSAMYGGGRGPGVYPDVLHPAPDRAASMMYSELAIARDVRPGDYVSTLLTHDGRHVPVRLTVAALTLPEPGAPRVWAYYDPRELVWAGLGSGTVARPSDEERACIAMFRAHGVLLSPDLPFVAFPARSRLLDGSPFVPAIVKDGNDVREWIVGTQGTGQVPFAIPIDEPRDADARASVRTLASEVRRAGGGPGKFLFAVTDEPHDDYGDLIDLYITLRPKLADTHLRWTYNGAPPRAGSMVVDTVAPPGPRTWGWIAHRWRIPVWYVWDALYWHDRHNREGAPLPGRVLDAATDATSFDSGEDHGNLDGVLALPGDTKTPCLSTVRLAAIHRGMQDRALIELASSCDAAATDALVTRMVPRALGDAPSKGPPAWPTTETAWEQARRELIAIAARCVR